jgi:hypothetical protein
MYNTKETEFKDFDWINLAQDRVNSWVIVSTVMSFRIPYTAGYFLAS